MGYDGRIVKTIKIARRGKLSSRKASQPKRRKARAGKSPAMMMNMLGAI